LADQLHQAERLANLGQMVATVSHEIRNPLGIISSSADFLSGNLKDSPKLQRLAGAIVDESERLWRILTDFLEFARPQEPEFKPAVVEDILEEILVLLETDMRRAGVELLTEFRSDPGPVPVDVKMLHRAFVNLLVNAIQAMPDGGLLTVGTSLSAEGGVQGGLQGGRLIVAISDTGPGLSKEAAEHVFKPFRTTKTKGTGLGLALVRSVVESHGGELSLVNIEGGPDSRGLRVTLALPLSPRPVSPEELVVVVSTGFEAEGAGPEGLAAGGEQARREGASSPSEAG
jgi:signal transduction histidine kinase